MLRVSPIAYSCKYVCTNHHLRLGGVECPAVLWISSSKIHIMYHLLVACIKMENTSEIRTYLERFILVFECSNFIHD